MAFKHKGKVRLHVLKRSYLRFIQISFTSNSAEGFSANCYQKSSTALLRPLKLCAATGDVSCIFISILIQIRIVILMQISVSLFYCAVVCTVGWTWGAQTGQLFR